MPVKRLVAVITAMTLVFAVPLPANAATGRTYVISTTSKPCSDSYKSKLNKVTHDSIVLRTYMEKLEKEGGGKLVIKAGTYNLNNVVYIPSNVMLIMKEGVKLNKTYIYTTMKPSKSMFQLCTPSVAKEAYANYDKTGRLGTYKNGYTRYNGVHDIDFDDDESKSFNSRIDWGAYDTVDINN